MTNQQHNKILKLKAADAAMSDITDTVDLPFGTVKSLCFMCRALRTETAAEIHCSYCGTPILQRFDTVKRHFCDRHCYNKWWRSHNERGCTVYHKKCLHCNKSFNALTKKAQRYCSISCYQASWKAGDPIG